MIKRLSLFILLNIIALGLSAQTLTGYEYWFDDDYAGRSYAQSSSENINFSIDTKDLSWGLHAFYFRAVNDLENWSVPMVRWVYVFDKAKELNTDLLYYEYWIDNDYKNCVGGSLSGDQNSLPLKVNTAKLTQDMHLLHLRIGNMEHQWSETKHYVFYTIKDEKPAEPSKNTVYEYWFDNDFDSRVNKQTSANFLMFEADLSQLNYGLHTMHLRLKNDLDNWSAPKSYLLYTLEPTLPEPELSIVGYRYAFNNKVTFVPKKATNSQMLIAEFETPDVKEICPIDENCTFTVTSTLATLKRQAHVDFQFQLLNKEGNWGMPISQDYTEDVELSHTFTQMTVDEIYNPEKPLPGDFLATKITLEGENYSLSADQPCTVDLYNRRGTLLGSYNLLPGQNVNLELSATIYCVAYGMVKDAVSPQNKIRLLFSSDDTKALCYDINRDNKVDLQDVDCLREILVGRPNLEWNINAADVNNDNHITVSDIVQLLLYIQDR